jgi:hypothetical protein
MAARRSAIVARGSSFAPASLRPIGSPLYKPKRAVALLFAALLFGGCGAAAGDDGPGGLTLRVTRDFGRTELDSARLSTVPDKATALSLLRSESDVRAPGPGWTFFVNGVRPDVAAGEYELSPGDRVQWDERRGGSQIRVAAIVGAFPEPFRHGLQGERRPVRVECDDVESAPCRDAKQKLESVDVPVSGSSLGAPGTEHVTRLVVARWPRARIVRGAFTLELGPQRSGVFARFSTHGTHPGTLDLLDENGDVARTVHSGDGTGLVVALRPRADELLWLVTALDERGLAAGVRALREDRLRDAFAVAVTGRTVQKLPL